MHTLPIFYQELLHKSTFKLQKILQIRLRSFVNFHHVDIAFGPKNDVTFYFQVPID